jgi:hypothetical protein
MPPHHLDRIRVGGFKGYFNTGQVLCTAKVYVMHLPTPQKSAKITEMITPTILKEYDSIHPTWRI